MEPSVQGVLTVCSNGSAPLNNMATMPLYGKTHIIVSSLEPKMLWGWIFVYSIEDSRSTKFLQMMILEWPSPHLCVTTEHSWIICLGRLRIASKYIFNHWQLRQGVNSLAQWLEHWIFNREDPVRFPRQAWDFFSAMLHPFVTAFMS